MADTAMPGSLAVPVSDLRQVVLSGPGVEVGTDLGTSALRSVARAGTVDAVLAQVDVVGGRRRSLTPSVVTVLILGLCLFSGEGYSSVLARLWPLLGTFNPGLLLARPVTAVALSGARNQTATTPGPCLWYATLKRANPDPVSGVWSVSPLCTGRTKVPVYPE